jgi:hypothetical protein
MQMRRFLFFFISCITASTFSHAQTEKNRACFKLIEAFTQRTLPGRKETPPMAGTHFIIVWEKAKYPETFFWRGEGGWLSCNMLKAHKLINRPANMPVEIEYSVNFVTGDQVHKGDTLELSPRNRW